MSLVGKHLGAGRTLPGTGASLGAVGGDRDTETDMTEIETDTER